jgi:transcriptional regulator with XRE-family HTH domain
LECGGRSSGPKEGTRSRRDIGGFSAFLREARRAKGLSIRRLAEVAGVSNAYLSQVETGARGVPSPRILKRLARPLCVTTARLLEVAGYLPGPLPVDGSATVEMEQFLKESSVRFTLDGKPVSPEDIDAVLQFLRDRRQPKN